VEVKLVCHGACHNDTIVTVERKRVGDFNKSFSAPSLFETENEALPQAHVSSQVCSHSGFDVKTDRYGYCVKCNKNLGYVRL